MRGGFMLEIFFQKNAYHAIIDYALETCDSFSVVLEKDDTIHSQYVDQAFYDVISGFVVEKKSIGTHPYSGTEFQDSDFIRIENVKELKSLFFKGTTLEDWNGETLPQELCFYRNDQIWFWYVSHEKLAFLRNETSADIDFLEKNKIEYFKF